MFKKAPSEIQFILVTLVVVLLLGGPTVWSLIGDDKIAQHEVAQASRGVVSQGAIRKPASLPPTTSNKPARLSPLTQLDVSCVGAKQSPLKVHEAFVQFHGKNCLKGESREKIEIINRSNGYTASIFQSGSDRYQTDLIQLNNGENEIHIRYPTEAGIKEEILRVTSGSI